MDCGLHRLLFRRKIIYRAACDKFCRLRVLKAVCIGALNPYVYLIKFPTVVLNKSCSFLLLMQLEDSSLIVIGSY